MSVKKFFSVLIVVLLYSKYVKAQNDKIRIPVVFHVVHNQFTDGDISDNTFEELIYEINQGFNKVNHLAIDSIYRKDIANCNIEFYKPKVDENCNEIDFVSWDYTTKAYFVKKRFDKDLKKKEFNYLDSNKYLNIWVCEVGIINNDEFTPKAGYVPESSIPGAISLYPKNPLNDGVVINYNVIKNKENWRYWICHEIGHWLSLKHIWGKKGCSIDDGIEDTPMQNSPHEDGFTEVQNSCNDNTVKTNYQNFMDYSTSVGMFTNGQKDRMRKFLENKREDLLPNQDASCNSESNFSQKADITFDDFNTYILKSNNLNFRNNRNYLKKYSKLSKKKSILKYTHQNENLTEEDFNLLINKLQKKVNSFEYSKTYQKNVSFKLGYSSKEKKLKIKLPNELYATGINCILYDFKEINKPYQIMNSLALVGINNDEFKTIPVEKTQGVTPFFRSFKNSRVYAVIEYSLLPIKLKQRFNTGNTKMLGMFAYIHNVYLFSDKNHTNLIYTMNPKKEKEYFNNVSYGLYEYNNLSWRMRLIYN